LEEINYKDMVENSILKNTREWCFLVVEHEFHFIAILNL
jgi:hypothetical protein